MDELLVEIGAQPGQLLGVAQFGRGDHLVELRRPRLVVELRRQIGERPVGADRQHALLALVAGLAVHRRRIVVAARCPRRPRSSCSALAARLDLALACLALVVAFVALVLLLLVGALVLGAALVGFVGDHVALDQFEILEQPGREPRERALVVEREASASRSPPAFSSIQSRTSARPGRGARAALPRRSAARAPSGRARSTAALRRGLRARVIGSVRSRTSSAVARLAAMPRIAARAQRLDPRALDRIEHRARHRFGGAAFVQRGIVVLQPQREAVGESRAPRPPDRRAECAPASAP